jgi:molybdopterin-containing oxidoreductase family membrane subunit
MASDFSAIEGKSRRYYLMVAIIAVLLVAGFAAFACSYFEGHIMLGSNNAVPWGLPIIIAIYCIGLSAGSLILSSLTYVFGKEEYKPIARVAVFLAIALIFAAVIAIMVDLGRIEKSWRLFITGYYANMTSMFAINGILYGGYLVVSMVYLGFIMAGKTVWVKRIGIFAVCWAALVHMGTGMIFGMIQAREIMNSPMKPFEFVAAAIVSGLALLIIVVVVSLWAANREYDRTLVHNLGKLLLAFIGILVLMVLVDKLTHLYGPHRDSAVWLLTGSSWWMFWLMQVMCAYVIPAAILIHPKTRKNVNAIIVASVLVVIGIFGERLALVIPGTAYPLEFYPGHIEGTWGEVGSFALMPVELIMSVGLFALAGILYVLGLKYLPLLPAQERVKVEPVVEAAEPELQVSEEAPVEESPPAEQPAEA